MARHRILRRDVCIQTRRMMLCEVEHRYRNELLDQLSVRFSSGISVEPAGSSRW